MRTLHKVRKLSHDNFVESYGVMSRSKSVDGRAPKAPGRAVGPTESTEMYGTFRQRNDSASSSSDENQIDRMSSDNENNNNNNNNTNRHSTSEFLPSMQSQMSTDDEQQQPSLRAQTEVQYKGPANRRLRRFSLKKFPSTGDIHKAVTRRTKSEGTEEATTKDDDHTSNNQQQSGRITSWHSQFSINRRSKTPSSTSLRGKSPKRTLFRIPALSVSHASQSGYLDRRNKKRKWEKFWCVLQNSCLYCYNSPQSEFTQDVVVLRGYVVSADISDVQRAKFTFKLEQKGGSTYHFRCDNHQGFMQWICMINKESSDADPAMSDNEILMNNVKSCAKVLTRAQSSIYPSSPQMSPSMATPPPPNTLSNHNNKSMLSRRHTADNIFRMTRQEHLDLELQKENLLREVLEQQKEIIKERNSMIPTPKQNRPYYVPLVRGANSPIPSRDEVMEKYEKVKENQQMEILKSLTQLHTRRNSVQLKIDQLSRETKPKARRSRSANRYVIQSMEARLALLQSELAEIDQEIREQHVNKEDLADNINQKRDLEIMVLDQQECIDIVKRSNPSQRRYQHRQERGRRATRRIMPSNTPISFAHDHLTSIDEASTICESDSSSTSSGLSNSCSDLDSQTSGIMAISSTPRHKITDTGSVESIDADDTSRIDCISSHDETECFRSCRSIPVSKSSSCSSDADEIMSVEGVLSDDFRSLSTSSYSDLDTDGMCRQRTSSSDESLGKKSNDIRPDVLAEIEEFEVFSKMMLQRLNSATC
ncbi:uncharacterized protein LOC120327080 [Styela clava]